MKIVSVDPAAQSIGLALWSGGSLRLTSNLRLVPKDANYRAWKKKHGSRTEHLILKNLFNFLSLSPTWSEAFSSAEVVLFEVNTFSFSQALCFGLVAWLETHNPQALIHFFHPHTLSRFYGIGNLSRAERKRRIREIVRERVPLLPREVSQDETDAVLNIFYFKERKKPRPQIPQCPHWSLDSHPLTKP